MAQLCEFQCRVRARKREIVDNNSVWAVVISGTYAARPSHTLRDASNPIQFLNELIVVRYVVRSVTVAQPSISESKKPVK